MNWLNDQLSESMALVIKEREKESELMETRIAICKNEDDGSIHKSDN